MDISIKKEPYLVHIAMVYFDNDELRRAFLNALRRKKGLAALPIQFRYWEYKESEFDRLADTVRKHFDMEKFYQLWEQE